MKNDTDTTDNKMAIYHLIGIDMNSIAKAMIATFDSIDTLLDIIKRNPEDVLVYGSYKWFVLEKYLLNDVNCDCFEDKDFETWFTTTEEGKIIPIEKPPSMNRVFALSHKCSIY